MLEFIQEMPSQDWLNLGIALGVTIVVAFVGRKIINFIVKKGIRRLTRSTETKFDDLMLEAIQPPLYWFIVFGTADAMLVPVETLQTKASEFLNDLFFVLYFLAGFMLVWRLTARLFEWFAVELAGKTQDPKAMKGLIGFFDNLVLAVVAIVGLIVLLSHFGVNPTGLVTTLGVGSLAVALAAQSAFEDAISGLFIMIDQPFRVGDRIEIQDLDTWGDVVDIGLRSSRIRTRDNRMVIVPNSVIGKSLIVNHAYPDQTYRIEVHVGVAYGVDIEKARETIIEAVRPVDGILQDKPIEALFIEFGDSALIFRVRWWIDTYVDTRRMFDSVNTAIYKALAEAGIEIPFPQRDVYLKITPEDAQSLRDILKN